MVPYEEDFPGVVLLSVGFIILDEGGHEKLHGFTTGFEVFFDGLAFDGAGVLVVGGKTRHVPVVA